MLNTVKRYATTYLTYFLGLPKNCYVGFALNLAESTIIGVYYYLSIYFVNSLHFDIATAGFFISCFGIGAMLGGIIGGKLSDKWSPGITAAIALTLQTICYFVFAKTVNPQLIILNMVMLGIASYSFITANYSYVLNACKNNEKISLRAISILSMTSNLGLGISAFILSYALIAGFTPIFFVSACMMAFLAIISFCLAPHKTEEINRQNASDKMTVTSHYPAQVFITTLLSVFFVGLVVTQTSATYALYITSIFPDFGVQAVTTLFILNSAIVVVASTPICDYIEQFNKPLMVGVGGFLVGAGMFMLIFSHSIFIAILSCLIYTVGEIIFFAVAQLICYQYGSQKRGMSLGLYRTIYALSRIVGPSIGGLIYQAWNGEMVWFISGIIGLACLMTGYLYKNKMTLEPANI